MSGWSWDMEDDRTGAALGILTLTGICPVFGHPTGVENLNGYDQWANVCAGCIPQKENKMIKC